MLDQRRVQGRNTEHEEAVSWSINISVLTIMMARKQVQISAH